MLSGSFNHLLGSLQSSMYAKSAITLQHIELYKKTSDRFCSDIHESIDGMESFIKRVHDLNNEMKNMRHLYHNIKDLRKIVEIIQYNINTGADMSSLLITEDDLLNQEEEKPSSQQQQAPESTNTPPSSN